MLATNNWFGIFTLLVRTVEDSDDKRRVVDRTAYAAKLWREIVIHGGGQMSLKDALVHIQRIRTLNTPMPLGNEYPDLPMDRIEYYSSEPWKMQADDGARKRAVLRRDLRHGLRRILTPMSTEGVRVTLARSIRDVDQIPEGDYAVALIRAELERR